MRRNGKNLPIWKGFKTKSRKVKSLDVTIQRFFMQMHTVIITGLMIVGFKKVFKLDSSREEEC